MSSSSRRRRTVSAMRAPSSKAGTTTLSRRVPGGSGRLRWRTRSACNGERPRCQRSRATAVRALLAAATATSGRRRFTVRPRPARVPASAPRPGSAASPAPCPGPPGRTALGRARLTAHDHRDRVERGRGDRAARRVRLLGAWRTRTGRTAPGHHRDHHPRVHRRDLRRRRPAGLRLGSLGPRLELGDGHRAAAPQPDEPDQARHGEAEPRPSRPRCARSGAPRGSDVGTTTIRFGPMRHGPVRAGRLPVGEVRGCAPAPACRSWTRRRRSSRCRWRCRTPRPARC